MVRFTGKYNVPWMRACIINKRNELL
jgi:hypothetical protein